MSYTDLSSAYFLFNLGPLLCGSSLAYFSNNDIRVAVRSHCVLVLPIVALGFALLASFPFSRVAMFTAFLPVSLLMSQNELLEMYIPALALYNSNEEELLDRNSLLADTVTYPVPLLLYTLGELVLDRVLLWIMICIVLSLTSMVSSLAVSRLLVPIYAETSATAEVTGSQILQDKPETSCGSDISLNPTFESTNSTCARESNRTSPSKQEERCGGPYSPTTEDVQGEGVGPSRESAAVQVVCTFPSPADELQAEDGYVGYLLYQIILEPDNGHWLDAHEGENGV
ncbi:hypothetical protein CYMTET_14688 [Cymbomonas tetramitiformis]|uniref:Uncharacterized protein n=1 Tax=Cymbomonas tetramitiformis TaxID=36881 RepID=A0AAE0L9N6_9CHLO|nr:hypothetical protein CYMTET_14688 [Cymbomonas tetramitiformis]